MTRFRALATIDTPTVRRLATAIALAISLATVVAPTARAAGSGDLKWDDDGATFAVFGANETVSIAFGTIGTFCDSFFPTADVYVVAAPPALGAALADVNGDPNTVFGGTGGFFSDTIAFTSPTGSLPPGTYTVVYDECQEQRLDPEDSVFPNAFEVREATNVPPIDGAIVGLKQRAGTTAARLETFSNVISGLEAAQQLQAALACLTGPAACVVSVITDAVNEAVIEQIKLGLGLPTEDPKVLAKDVLADNIKHYKGIKDDPPDPSFALTTTLEAVAPLHPDDSDPRTLARFALANSHAQEAALAAALLHAIERYQGADIAGSGSWARLHARQARDLSGLLVEQLDVTKDALTSLRAAVVADSGDLDAVAATAAAGLSELATHGLTADAERRLLNLGFTRAQIASAAANLDGSDLAQFSETGMLAAIDGAIAAGTDLAGALEETATGMEVILAQLAGDPTVPADGYPVADAGGPYAASAGAPVTVAGVVTDTAGAATSAAWDLDRDGRFDDATGLTPTSTFATAFDGLIGLRAIDDEGHVSVDYARIRVDGDAPPSGTYTPAGLTQEAPLNTTIPFHVSASDPDQGDVGISWHLDGAEVATGPDFAFSPTAADAGHHVLEVFVTDGTNTIEHRWAVAAVLADADGDGWRANLDCDDSSAVRHPGLVEVGGNGVDDDCEPLTVDDQPAFDANLLVNANAEVGTSVPGGGLVAVPGWQTSGTNFTIVRYNDPQDGGFPRSTSPGPMDRGTQFFAGGPSSAQSTATQIIDLSHSSSAVDAGQVTFDLSAFIGGYLTQPDHGAITATFLDASNASLAAATIGPVTRLERGNLTGLLLRSASGPVPPGSRRVRVVMVAQRFEGAFNDGYFDNLRLILHGPGFDPAVPELEPAGDLVVPEGSTRSTTIGATAPDAVTLSAAGVPSFATFTDHGDGTATLTASPTDDADAAVVISACAPGGCQRRLVRVRGVNVAPAASATSNGPVAENSSATITATQDDPGTDTFTYAFDCDGDGSFGGFQDAAAVGCPFAAHGSHDVPVQVRDDDGGIGRASTDVLVTPRSVPVAEIARADSFDEGSHVRLDGRGSTSTNDVQLAFHWQQTGGPPVTLSSASVTRPSFTAPDNGQYRFSLVVTAGQSSSALAEVTVDVTNVIPQVEVTNDGPAGAGRPVHVTAKASDPGTGDSFVYAFDCEGDGTFGPDTGDPTAVCVFTETGSHVVRARVTDDDGGAGGGETTVRVDASAPSVTLTDPANGSSTLDTTPALKGVADTAPGDEATVTVRIYAGAGTGGTLTQTRTTTRDPSTGGFAIDAETLAAGTYTAQAEQSDGTGNTGRSSANTFQVESGAHSVVVADRSAFGGSGGVIRVNAMTGARTTVSRNSSPAGSTEFVDPTSIAAERHGQLVVADPSAFGGSGGVIRVNLLTGARTTVSRNSKPAGSTQFVDPTSVAVEANGSILVADPSAFGGSGGVIRVNPLTGARTTVSRNSSPAGSTTFADPVDLAVEANGTIIVADPGAFGGSGGVIRVNPLTGARTTVSRNSSPAGSTQFVNPTSLVVEASGDIVVADLAAFGGSGGVLRVNSQTGARTTISRNTNPTGATAFVDPIGIAVEPNGSILISDTSAFGGSGGVVRVSPLTGARSSVSRNTSPTGSPAFVDPTGLVVVPTP